MSAIESLSFVVLYYLAVGSSNPVYRLLRRTLYRPVILFTDPFLILRIRKLLSEILQTYGRKFRHTALRYSSLVFRMTSFRIGDEQRIKVHLFTLMFNFILLFVIPRYEGSQVVLKRASVPFMVARVSQK